ncbi:DUF7532 family protein [Salarchaeum japonicum]|uniref:Uncharacterized protein n=1 Tax=Salarchaeum japonicum TaxID=555573 RepID=A0AAV3T0D4_9EURY|nr:hypothetical protein [Salarchaeum japonicum]
MLFDQRVRTELHDAGVDPATLREIEERVAADARETAERVAAFFDAHDTVYSDMELTHSSSEHPEHAVEYADLFTHSEDVRGFLRFDTWGAYVENARVLDAEDGRATFVELELGQTVHDRVRFAPARERLE